MLLLKMCIDFVGRSSGSQFLVSKFLCGVAMIKGKSFRSEHVTKISWHELINAYVIWNKRNASKANPC